MKASILKFLHYPVHASSSLSLLRPGPQQTVLVDFSSPNIAKPFHLGHFRATVTGNFVRNVNEAMNHRVVAINYLGDWGTQFDVLSRAFQQHGSWDRLYADPMRHLQEIYVRANQEQATSPSPSAESPQPCPINCDPDQLAWWTQVRQMTIAHLTQTYARMNVQFTAFEYESDYVDSAKQLVDRLLVEGLAATDSDGVVCFRNSCTTTATATSNGRYNSRIALRKSNGSTLYLTRDIAAAISRYDRYRFDRLHYVVEDAQRLHFQNLCSVLQQLHCSWLNAHNPEDPSLEHPFSRVHVPFGRVQGASTRRGQGLTLADILDNAQQTILRRMAQSRTTRVPSATDSNLSSTERQITLDVADHLGVTCLVVEMLRQRRQKPIHLRWFLGYPVDHTVQDDDLSKENNSTVDHTDLSGLGVQYCHARLCSLERRAIQSGVIPSDPTVQNQCDLAEFSERLDRLDPGLWSVEQQSALHRLHEHLVGFESALHAAYVNYEASILVQFATKLTAQANVAWKQMPVLTCPDRDERLMRLAIFLAVRNVLAICLRLLGIRPLRTI